MVPPMSCIILIFTRGPLLAIQRTETCAFCPLVLLRVELADPSSLFRGLKHFVR